MGIQGAEAEDESQLQTKTARRDARILQNAAELHQKLGDAKLLGALDQLDFGLHFRLEKYEAAEGILRTDARIAQNCEKWQIVVQNEHEIGEHVFAKSRLELAARHFEGQLRLF